MTATHGIAAALLAVLSVAAAHADGQRFESGPNRVELIELYTSEGCSSCPPADRWLSKLKKHPGLWSEFVPIAFHVDYWDYIGWQDRFASPEFSERQLTYAREGSAPFVYTPGVFRSGDDWRNWRDRRSGSLQPGPGVEAGVLTVEVEGDAVHVHFAAADSGSNPYIAHVALLGMGLSTDVRAGENRGKTLKHDFVALDVRSTTLKEREGVYAATLSLNEATISGEDEAALVAWVSGSDSQVPLQAVGGFLAGK